MAFTKRKRHLLILLYAGTLALLIASLFFEIQRDQPVFSLSHTSFKESQTPDVLSVYGENLHAEISAVLATTLVHEDALLWRPLVETSAVAVDISGNMALVASYNKEIISIDLHDGNSPQSIGFIKLPDFIRQIQIVGDQALVGMMRHGGLYQISLKDPSAMKIVRHFPLPGLPLSMVVDRNVIYYTDFYQGLGWLDLSAEDPVPEILVAMKSPWRIALQGSKVAVGTISEGVRLFDIIQSGQLVEVGRLDYPDVRGVAFVDESLAVALADGTLHLLDVAPWPVLNDSAQLVLPGQPILCERVPGQAALAVGLIAAGMVLVDVSSPDTPTISGLLKRPETFKGMKLYSGKVYGVSRNGLEVFALDKIAEDKYSSLVAETGYKPDHYQLRSWKGHVYGYNRNHLTDFGERVSSEIFSSDRLMAIAGNEGVRLFEERENGQVQRVGPLITLEGVRDARFRDDYLYVIHQGGLRILFWAWPEEPVVVSDLALSDRPERFEILASGYLLVATANGGVLVVNVNDPQKPKQVASIVPPPHLKTIEILQDVLVDGSRVYLSMGAGGVHVIDMSIPSQPQLLQIVHTPEKAQRMVLYDNLLLVASGGSNLFMIDVKNREFALPIGILPTPLRIDQMALVDGGLIVSSHPGGTMRLPLPQRVKPLRFVNEGEVRVDAVNPEKGQYVYLYDELISRRVAVSIQ